MRRSASLLCLSLGQKQFLSVILYIFITMKIYDMNNVLKDYYIMVYCVTQSEKTSCF